MGRPLVVKRPAPLGRFQHGETGGRGQRSGLWHYLDWGAAADAFTDDRSHVEKRLHRGSPEAAPQVWGRFRIDEWCLIDRLLGFSGGVLARDVAVGERRADGAATRPVRLPGR